MKILYVTTTTDLGGAEKALLDLVRTVAKNNQVKVVSLKPLGTLSTQFKETGAQLVSCNMNGWGWNALRTLSLEIKSFQPDIIHAILFRGMEFTRFSNWKNAIPLITTPHFDLSKKNFILRGIDRILRRRDFCTIAESKSTYQYLLAAQKYPKEHVLLINNAPEEGKFFPDIQARQRMRQTYKFTEKQPVFISVARLEKEKNPLLLLRAFLTIFQKNKEVRLVLVGQGSLKDDLMAFIKEKKLQNAVFLVGEQNNINDWLNMADVFVLPSEEESLPLSLLEALQTGKPCIVSNVGDMVSWVNHGENGFVINKGDENQLSNALARLAEQVDLRKNMSEKSLKKSTEIEDMLLKYQHLYQQILEESFHVKTLK